MQVDLYENGTIAIVEAVSPELGNRVQRVRVQLPGTSQELLNKFREKKIDFAAHSNTEDGGAVFLNLLGASLTCSCCKHNWFVGNDKCLLHVLCSLGCCLSSVMVHVADQLYMLSIVSVICATVEQVTCLIHRQPCIPLAAGGRSVPAVSS